MATNSQKWSFGITVLIPFVLATCSIVNFINNNVLFLIIQKLFKQNLVVKKGSEMKFEKKNQLPKKLALAVLFLSSCSSSSCGSFAISQITSSEDWNYFPISNWNTFLFLIDFFFSIWKYLGIFSLFRNVCYLFFHDISKNHFLLADMEQNAVLVK